MNIFQTIGSVTNRNEPFHSQFLADALEESLNGDRSFFDAVWNLAAAPGWKPPDRAVVTTEEVVEKGQIDICVRTENPYQRILGIEVKVSDASAHFGQLERYREGLKNRFPRHDIQISYLTPFNSERAGDAAESLRTVQVFEEFVKVSPAANHLSWLDVAEIPWDGGELWEQHQRYVCNRISSTMRLEARSARNRQLANFFGDEPTERFRDALWDIGIQIDAGRTDINLYEFGDGLSFAKSLVKAIMILLDSDDISHRASRSDRFTDELRQSFLDSPHREVHRELFSLSDLLSHVWIKGDANYGVRTAHKKHPGGVSIVTSNGPDRLFVGALR